jgi:hypothetical protein
VIWPANQADKQDNLANKGTIGNLRGLKLTLLKEQGIRKTNSGPDILKGDMITPCVIASRPWRGPPF